MKIAKFKTCEEGELKEYNNLTLQLLPTKSRKQRKSDGVYNNCREIWKVAMAFIF